MIDILEKPENFLAEENISKIFTVFIFNLRTKSINFIQILWLQLIY
jgi:hypothetical protein